MKLRAGHVDCFRRLRLSMLMGLFQECCIAHTEALGMGREKTLDRGFLWVINSEAIEIRRLPEYDEEITLICYPGKMLHFFFPRQMIVTDKDGCEIIRIGALWSLIDETSRQLIDPEENGILLPGENRQGDIIPALSLPKASLPFIAGSRYASYSLVDINGHLNNTSYLDMASDLIGFEELERSELRSVKCLFRKEIPAGTGFEICWGKENGSYRFQNEFFTLEMDFTEK